MDLVAENARLRSEDERLRLEWKIQKMKFSLIEDQREKFGFAYPIWAMRG